MLTAVSTPEAARPPPPAAPWAASWCTVGVTGTNGKSSTTALLAAALASDGAPVLAATTLGYRLADRPLPTPASWRDFLDLCALADRRGCRRAAVELTSQALARGHARRWRFDHAIFTNLSEDHLSAHGSWEHYLASKAQLFINLGPGRRAILNAADPAALLLDQVIPGDVERLWYGAPSRGEFHTAPALAAERIDVSARGTEIHLQPSPLAAALGARLHLQMIGEIYAENALAAAAAALTCGLPGAAIAAALAATPPLPGRFELLCAAPLIAIDYAHTPDALTRTMATARRLAGDGRVIVVFGAGGGADPSKRPAMGAAVGDAADLAIITNDNPRDEAPEQIAAALHAGAIGRRAELVRQLDRAQAISAALAAAQPRDIVVIAGKGHERGQSARGTISPFSDHDVVAALIGDREVGLCPSHSPSRGPDSDLLLGSARGDPHGEQ
jgi:UDP-N-acetylmuramoyl-L-alanyl-D-glutamate--2,6-diaminopimelate ligase